VRAVYAVRAVRCFVTPQPVRLVLEIKKYVAFMSDLLCNYRQWPKVCHNMAVARNIELDVTITFA